MGGPAPTVNFMRVDSKLPYVYIYIKYINIADVGSEMSKTNNVTNPTHSLLKSRVSE